MTNDLTQLNTEELRKLCFSLDPDTRRAAANERGRRLRASWPVTTTEES